MAVTLKDIAKRVGVSTTTVSLVLNQRDDSRIGEETRQKILETSKELGYQTERIPQVSTFPIHPTIGLVIADIKNPFFTNLASTIEDVASRYGYNIILCNTHEHLEKENEFLEVLWRRKVHGLILAAVDDKQSNPRNFLKHHIPLVLVDRYLRGTETNAVLVDNVDGAYRAIEYLVGLGHQRIGIITGREHVTTNQDRLQGYLNALEAHGLPADQSLIHSSHYTVEGGQQATAELLELPSPPTAIFSCGGTPTVGVLMEFKRRGIRIPDDMSLLGFDDDRWATLIEPPMTVIAQPVEEIGREAAQLIIQMIQGWNKREIRKIVLKTELIIRESCRAINLSQ